MRIFSTKFEGCCKYFSPTKLVSLRKLAPSQRSLYRDLYNQNGMDIVTEISFCKNPVDDEKMLVFLEDESQLGKSFKVSV